jgi:transposase
VGCQTHRQGWGDRPDERPQECAADAARSTPVGGAHHAQGWTVAQAAQGGGLSTSRAYHWLARYRWGGAAALADLSSAPQHCRNRTSAERIVEIERRRRQRLSGPTIARQLGIPVSTVGKVLRRLGLGKLSALEP